MTLMAEKEERKHGLAEGFLRTVEACSDRPALEAGGEALSYGELFDRAASLAATLDSQGGKAEGPPLTAVFTSRSATAFAGVLAALLRGHGYVPLNRAFPADRTRTMLSRSGCRALIVDRASEEQLGTVLDGIEDELLVVLPERRSTHDLAERWKRHRFIGSDGLVPRERWAPVDVDPDALAYLLFTSGSTGVPKGVAVSHGNVGRYVDFVTGHLKLTPQDRLSQTFDLTFDLSAGDIFAAWESGACLCCPSEKALINPGRLINDAGLTVWFSVPSTAVFMKRLGALKAGAYPRLRISLFCGEAFPIEIAAAWAAAAPHSVVENFYGPTELTIACTHYRWDPVRSPEEAALGLVPIGSPFPGMRSLVVDDALREVDPGGEGELLMAGPQLSLGYWNDPDQTAASFVHPPGMSQLFYRTGDRVRRPRGDGPLLFLGRIDNQIKVLGHRVELGEVEAVVREESGIDGVIALGWPRNAGCAGGVEVFLQAEGPAQPDLLKRVARRLPAYMVPRRFHFLPAFPLNANGKFDRKALIDRLETMP